MDDRYGDSVKALHEYSGGGVSEFSSWLRFPVFRVV
jgi:hypothetical protein